MLQELRKALSPRQLRSLGLPIIALASGCLFTSPPYHGPRSRHFDGQRFVNSHNPSAQQASSSAARTEERARQRRTGSLADIIRWQLERQPTTWPRWVPRKPGPRPPSRVSTGRIRVTFVNHATALIQMDGLNILTDPVWSDRVGPVPFAGAKRVHAPGLRFEDLPPIDLVLVSHNHYDHLDLPTLRRLQASHAPQIAVGLGTAALLRSKGIRRVRDFDWWDSRPVSRAVRITAVPAQHSSMRGLADYDTSLWVGFVVEGPSGRVYFAGDTGDGTHFEAIRRRFGAISLALLPIGAYEPRWFMAPVHLNPQEAVRAHLELEAELSIAIHHGTFDLADEDRLDPVVDLARALAALKVPPGRFVTLSPGEGRELRSSLSKVGGFRGSAAPAGGESSTLGRCAAW